jgi:methyl-accepting chemotaxis protein
MSWKDLKIAQKLYIGFGSVLLLTLLTGYAGYNGLNTFSASVTNSDDAGQLAKWIKDVAVARRDFYLTNDEKYIETLKSTVAEMTKTMDGMKTRLETQGEKDAVEKVNRLLNGDYMRVLTAQIDNVRAQTKAKEDMELAENAARDLIRGNAGLNRFLADLQDCRVPAKTYLLAKNDDQTAAVKVADRMNNLIQEVGSSSNSLQMALTAFKDNFGTVVKLRVAAIPLAQEIAPLAAGLVKGCDDIRETQQQNAQQSKNTAVTLSLIFVFGALAIGTFVAFFISRAIANPIKAIARVADDVSVGDIQHEIHFESKDEIGVLAESFRRLIDYMKSLAGAAERIAANDLTVTVEAKSEKDVLGNAFKTMTANLTTMIRQLTDNSTQLVSAATEIASTSEQMARGSQEQTGQTSQVSSAVEEMTATIVESSKNAGEAAGQAKEAANAARAGNQVVTQTIEGMNRIAQVVQESAKTVQELAKSSDKIGEIIGVIDDIADQTNLLALNAAIEAARAGEQGRGFAVVADEVRKLAERTGKATKEITDMIKGIQNDTKGAVAGMEQGINEVQQGRELADKAGESLTAIATYSQKVMDMIQQIATAAEEQSAASEQIARSVEGIARVTKENAAGVEQSAAAAEELNRQAEGMRGMVAQFRLSGGNTGILEMAKNDHRIYIEKLKSVITGKTPTSSWKTVDSHTCRFGKWYHSHEAGEFRSLREFAEIAKPHAQVHDLANEAVKNLTAGDKARAQKLHEQALSASHEVVEHIEHLQRAIATGVQV